MKTWKDLRLGETHELYKDQVSEHIISVIIGKYAFYPKSLDVHIQSESGEYGYPLPRTSQKLSLLIKSLQKALIALEGFEQAIEQQEKRGIE